MVREIKILPPELAAKIAAGEVIERPAQAVKELVENSIDAGSTDISVEIKKGGKLLIRVADNGSGMRPEDLELAFSRHATSKISNMADLERITTLGFRGEALASLASCSRIEAITRTEEVPVARVIRIEGGKVKFTGKTARTRGTTIESHDLFFNLPARRKFLKSEATEAGHILDILSQMAIAHTSIRFRLEMDGNIVFDLPADLSFARRVGEVYHVELEKELIPLRGEKDGMRIIGGILPPTVTRANRELQIFLVNRRAVKSPLLGHALNSAYHSLIPSGKFPVAFILLEIPPEEVDVNIHPTKREIKFVREKEVHALVAGSIRLAFQNIRSEESVSEKTASLLPTFKASAPAGNSQLVREEVEAYLDEIMGPVNIIGQVKDTYLVMEKEDGLELIDQHAAQERILYEGLKKDIVKGTIERQVLLFPLTLEIGLGEAIFIRERMDLFSELGIEIEEFGKNTFQVRALPSRVKTGKLKDFVLGFIKELAEIDSQKSLADLRDEALKVMACRGAIMAGDKLSTEERIRLLADLDRCPDNLTCPHGRPIRTKFFWGEIEKRFRRG